MIIELVENIEDPEIERLQRLATDCGYKTTEVRTQKSHYIVAIGDSAFDIRAVGHSKGVKDVHRVSDPYKFVSRKWKACATEVDLGDGVLIREGDLTIIGGPCSIENEQQVSGISKHLSDSNVRIMRGGAFKPRTSPYAFRGLGLEGLEMFYELASANNMKVVSEVMEVSQVESMYDYVDMYQVGARNTQNFNLLNELGNVDKPVLIKRGISGTIEELLQSAEYVFSSGNEQLVLCERGIRTFERSYRNTLDLNAIPILKEKSHLPVIVDPSHGIGVRRFVEPVALAGILAGADGLIYEVHENPEQALSDAQQTLNFDESRQLIEKARKVFDLRCDMDLMKG